MLSAATWSQSQTRQRPLESMDSSGADFTIPNPRIGNKTRDETFVNYLVLTSMVIFGDLALWMSIYSTNASHSLRLEFLEGEETSKWSMMFCSLGK